MHSTKMQEDIGSPCMISLIGLKYFALVPFIRIVVLLVVMHDMMRFIVF